MEDRTRTRTSSWTFPVCIFSIKLSSVSRATSCTNMFHVSVSQLITEMYLKEMKIMFRYFLFSFWSKFVDLSEKTRDDVIPGSGC